MPRRAAPDLLTEYGNGLADADEQRWMSGPVQVLRASEQDFAYQLALAGPAPPLSRTSVRDQVNCAIAERVAPKLTR